MVITFCHIIYLWKRYCRSRKKERKDPKKCWLLKSQFIARQNFRLEIEEWYFLGHCIVRYSDPFNATHTPGINVYNKNFGFIKRVDKG